MKLRAAVLGFLMSTLGLVLSPAAPAASAAQGPDRYSGTGCTSAVAIFAMPIARARAAVPAPFQAFDYGTLLGTGRVQFTRCDQVRLDGGSVGPATFSTVSVDIEPPKGAPGTSVHSYVLWTLITRGDLAARYAGWGMAGGFVPDLTLDDLAPEPFASARGDSDWTRSSYNLTLTAPDPTAGLPAATIESHWHRGPAGTFRTLANLEEVFRAGAAVVQTTPGSELSSLFAGLPVMAGAGQRRTFSFTATIEAVAVSA